MGKILVIKGADFSEVAVEQVEWSSQDYDARISYLESTGTQYINTGVVAKTGVKVEAKFMVTADNNDTAVCGVRYNMRFAPIALNQYRGNNAVNFLYGAGGNTDSINKAVQLSRSEYSTVIADSAVGVISLDVNGSITTLNTLTQSVDTGVEMPLFARSWDGVIGAFAKIRLAYCKIWVDNELMRDYIPVRVGSIGYLFDKVSRNKFGNIGTGAFVLGADV